MAEHRDDHVRPETRTVFAQSPSLVLAPPHAGGDPEFLLGLTSSDDFLGVELREMLADDLLGPVLLDALSSGVPQITRPLGSRRNMA